MKRDTRIQSFTEGRPPVGSRRWFQVNAKLPGETPTVYIYDEIGRGFFGGGMAPEDLMREVDALKLSRDDELVVRIESPGGDFFDGNTMYNWLRSQKFSVRTLVDGIAGSAASIIYMAGDVRVMPENTFLFIHEPWTVAAGNAKAFRKQADDLEILTQSAVATYMRGTDGLISRADLAQLLDEETYLSAERAVELGFAHQVLEPVRAAALARFDLDAYGYRNVPAAIVQAKQALAQDRVRRREQLKALAI